MQFKATGVTAEAEYKNDKKKGLYAEHRSDGVAWFTYSKGSKHGLAILPNNDIILWEAGKNRKEFNQEECKQIIEGTLDVTQFFENKDKSTKRLNFALKGRPVYPGQKEREEFMERVSELREEIKYFRELHEIEDPPEYAEGKKEEEKEKK
jgi:hypothetical protein